MRVLSALILSGLLLAPGASAADAVGVLPSGKPAGTRQAQMENSTPWVLIGLGAIVVIAIVAASSGGKDRALTPTTTGTAG